MNMVALVDGQPRLLNLKELLEAFISPPPRGGHAAHGVRAAQGARARPRAGRPGGGAVQRRRGDRADQEGADARPRRKRELMARAWRSELVEQPARRAATWRSIAPEGLTRSFGLKAGRLSPVRRAGAAILELRLQRLTGLEQDKIRDEYREVIATIADLLDILAKPARITADHRRRARRAEGGVRRQAPQRDRHRRRGHLDRGPDRAAGHGGHVLARRLHQVAAARRVPRAEARRPRQDRRPRRRKTISSSGCSSRNSHDYLLCFSNRGQLYWLKVYEVPQGSRIGRGKPIVNLFPLEEGEKITAVVPVKEFDDEPLRVHGDRAGHGEEDRARRVLAPAAERHHRRGPGRGRLPGRRGAHRRQVRRDAVLLRGQGGALRGGRRAPDGPPGAPACAA